LDLQNYRHLSTEFLPDTQPVFFSDKLSLAAFNDLPIKLLALQLMIQPSVSFGTRRKGKHSRHK
jgi:hypothetical protein